MPLHFLKPRLNLALVTLEIAPSVWHMWLSEVWFHDRYLDGSWSNAIGGAINDSLVSAVGYFEVYADCGKREFQFLLWRVATVPGCRFLIAILSSIVSQITQNDASLQYPPIYGLQETQRC
jgi:hypothetical protein